MSEGGNQEDKDNCNQNTVSGSDVLHEHGWTGHLGLGCFLGWPQTDATRGIKADKELDVPGAGPGGEPSTRLWPGV